jgi:hypothetical protein
VGPTRERLAPTLQTALTRSDDVYLEYLVPGGPVLQLAGRAGDATFVLPRDRRVLRAPTRDIVSALTGLRWGATQLLDVLSGCVTEATQPITGQRTGRFVQVSPAPDVQVWLTEQDGRWRVHAADMDGWLIEYRAYEAAWPIDVRVTASGETPVDLVFALSQIQTNIDLPAATFTLTVPPDFAPMSLEELRANGPLRERKQ